MKKSNYLFVITTGLLFVCFTSLIVAQDLLITIDVAPNVLNLENQGTVVTVHTNIAYSAVEGSSLTLNDVPIYYWKSDSRGYFVAKFTMSSIKALPLKLNEYNTMRMIGETKSGVSFEGTQEILVVKNESSGKK